jgi:hypothetical protein
MLSIASFYRVKIGVLIRDNPVYRLTFKLLMPLTVLNEISMCIGELIFRSRQLANLANRALSSALDSTSLKLNLSQTCSRLKGCS